MFEQINLIKISRQRGQIVLDHDPSATEQKETETREENCHFTRDKISVKENQ